METKMTITKEEFDRMVEEKVKVEIKDAVQILNYQLETLLTSNGQTPFISVCLDLGEAKPGKDRDDLAQLIAEVLRQRIKGMPDQNGNYITPAFPKLLYVLHDYNTEKGSQYEWLTKLAAECASKRMVPDFISAKKMMELKGDVYPCMGCRSFLTPDTHSETVGNISRALNFDKSKHHYYGRFNQGVVTLNLVDVSLTAKEIAESTGRDLLEVFEEVMDERLDLCHKALRTKHEYLLGTKSDVAPILWQDGALARFKPGEVIDPLLFDNYSTISLGYAGLYECVYAMVGHTHTDMEEGTGIGEFKSAYDFAIHVMQRLNDACATWRAAENIGYSVYGSPIESTTYKFAKALQKRFGIIPEVTDHAYITNSYHVNVREEISAFDKLKIESKFQELSPGGAISYIETANLADNQEAVMTIIRYMYDTILYSEINSKFDFCDKCGFSGEMKPKREVDENGNEIGNYFWECPNCGNNSSGKKMINPVTKKLEQMGNVGDTIHIARRICGYISTNDFNFGRGSEIVDRKLHL